MLLGVEAAKGARVVVLVYRLGTEMAEADNGSVCPALPTRCHDVTCENVCSMMLYARVFLERECRDNMLRSWDCSTRVGASEAGPAGPAAPRLPGGPPWDYLCL